jgi:hypothetical protein
MKRAKAIVTGTIQTTPWRVCAGGCVPFVETLIQAGPSLVLAHVFGPGMAAFERLGPGAVVRIAGELDSEVRDGEAVMVAVCRGLSEAPKGGEGHGVFGCAAGMAIWDCYEEEGVPVFAIQLESGKRRFRQRVVIRALPPADAEARKVRKGMHAYAFGSYTVALVVTAIGAVYANLTLTTCEVKILKEHLETVETA